MLRQDRRDGEHDRGVRVVAARVHLARDLRRVRQAVRLAHRQRVHVGANRDRGSRLAAFEQGNDAGPAHVGAKRNAARGQKFLHALRGLVLLERELRMRVDLAPQRDHVVHPALGGCVDR